MKSYREQFEEIWPVPEAVYWDSEYCEYLPNCVDAVDASKEWDARLDTFTRCQETTNVYASLIDEMIYEVEGLSIEAYGCVIGKTQDIIDRAQSLLDDKK